jgi:two-component system response regulator MprA
MLAAELAPTAPSYPADPSALPRVLAVDDERRLRDLLEAALPEYGFEVRTAEDGVHALQLVREWQPETIVLDVMMPRLDGIDFIPLARKLTDAPIVMLSAKGDLQDKVRGLLRGADDYLPKPFAMSELAARLHSALRRPRLDRVSKLVYADVTIDLETRDVRRGEKSVTLSGREFALLTALVRNAERVLTRRQLLDLAWGRDRDVAPGAVDTYVSYLRRKLEDEGRGEILRTVRGVGYVLRAH